jgi:formylmethanofuran dehydrogenase subunit B
MRELGYDAEVLYIDLGTTAESAITKKLTHTRFDCVLIGAGVRTSVEHFLNFEKVVNIVHQHAPSARICFNTNPFDSTAAFQRWV